MSIAPLDGPFGCLAHGKAQLDSHMDSVTSWSIAQTLHKPVPGLQEKPLDARRSVKVSLPLRAVSGTQAKRSAGRNQAGELGFPIIPTRFDFGLVDNASCLLVARVFCFQRSQEPPSKWCCKAGGHLAP